MFIVKLYYRIETFHVQTSYKTGGLLTEKIQSWLFVQCFVPIDRGIQFALRKMIACKNWSQRRISAKLKSHFKFPHIHFVRIRKNVNIYFFVSTLNKEINIYACICSVQSWNIVNFKIIRSILKFFFRFFQFSHFWFNFLGI